MTTPTTQASVTEALNYALACAQQELAEASNLYGGYPEDGLGRKVKAARQQLEMIEAALASQGAALGAQAVPAGWAPARSSTAARARPSGRWEPAVSRPAIFLDSFSGAIADLPKGCRSADYVLAVLRDNPRVSCFDMSETPWIRNIINDLKLAGAIQSVTEPYPWLRFKVLKGQP